MQSTKTTLREFSAISFETNCETIAVNLSPVRADLFVFIIIFYLIIFYYSAFVPKLIAHDACMAKMSWGDDGAVFLSFRKAY